MKKYILDTSVLITNPSSFKDYHDSKVIIPIAVLDELDKLKKNPGDVGRNARVAIRLLDDISNKGDISLGILLENDILFKIDVENYPMTGDALYGDTRIIACAQAIAKDKEEDTVVVSNDINMRVRARALGMLAENYEHGDSQINDLYAGIQKIHDDDALADLLNNDSIYAAGYDIELNPNECILFIDEDGNEMAKARQIGRSDCKIINEHYPWGLSPRNIEQEFAIDLIMDPKIPLVTLIGQAGTGKSLIALASALELVIEKRFYNKFIIYRPIQPMGNDLGYLPGSKAEKLEPWFQAIMDNFEILFTTSNGDKWKSNLEFFLKKDKIQMEALTYIRGRSIPNAIIMLDEAQNLSAEEMKTILTRVGDNTKIILTGDISQIDKSSLDAMNNGLTYVIEKFKNSELAGHITFVQGERSKLASKAAEIL